MKSRYEFLEEGLKMYEAFRNNLCAFNSNDSCVTAYVPEVLGSVLEAYCAKFYPDAKLTKHHVVRRDNSITMYSVTF